MVFTGRRLIHPGHVTFQSARGSPVLTNGRQVTCEPSNQRPFHSLKNARVTGRNRRCRKTRWRLLRDKRVVIRKSWRRVIPAFQV